MTKGAATVFSDNSSALQAHMFSEHTLDHWLNTVFDQMSSQRAKYTARPVLIKIDYNLTHIDKELAEYAINIIKHEINSAFFELVSEKTLTLFIMLYSVIILFGVVSNALLIYAFYKSVRLRTFRNVYIINLAISDILLCAVCAPLTLARSVDSKWNLGRFVCKLGPGLQTVNVMVTIFSITAIALDRLKFIVHVGKDRTKNRFVVLSIVLIWLAAVLIGVPSFVVNDLKIFELKSTREVLYTVCEELWIDYTYKYAYCALVVLFQYVLPVVIVAAANYKICHVLRFHVLSLYSSSVKKHLNVRRPSDSRLNAKVDGNDGNNGGGDGDENGHDDGNVDDVLDSFRQDANRQSIKLSVQSSKSKFQSKASVGTICLTDAERFARSKYLLLFVSLSFALCWLPLFIFNLFLDIFEIKSIAGSNMATIYLSVHLVAMSSCCINPILYGLLNTNFKDEIVKIFQSTRFQSSI